MNKNNCYCVIMAGGAGTRFWPVSRVDKPKQFLDVAETGKTFIRHTYDRMKKVVPQENIIIMTASKYRDLVMEQIPELESHNLLLEPYPRNTAPSTAYATYTLLKRNPEAQFVVMPADYIIENEDLFVQTISSAFDYIEQNDVLLTFGVIPTRPDTNYGYAQVCGGSAALKSKEPVKVKTFTEKPDKELAKIFLATGEFLWNAGMFLWKAETFRKEMERHMPQVTGYFKGWEHVLGTSVEPEFITKAFSDCMNISLAYGVMEKTERAWIYPVGFDWQDVGTWESLYNYMAAIRDRNGNAVSAEKTLTEDTKDTLIISPEKKKLVAINGLEDFIVVDTDDVLLICPKDDKKFKDFISQIAMPEFEKYR